MPGVTCQMKCTQGQMLTGRLEKLVFKTDHGGAVELETDSGSHSRSLGNALQQEAILELRQLLDEHAKRKRPV